MAIAFTNLGASAGGASDTATNPDINTTASASSYANSSWTPPTEGIIIVFVIARRQSGGPDTPTMSGNNLTWTQIGTPVESEAVFQLTMFAADASGATTGATTIDFGGNTQICCTASLFQATGVDLTGGIAAVFVQTPGVTLQASSSTGSVTLSAAADADNRPIAAFTAVANTTATPRTNWTEIDDMKGSSRNRVLQTQYRDDAFETTASVTFAAAGKWGAIAAELKIEAAAGTPFGQTRDRGGRRTGIGAGYGSRR